MTTSKKDASKKKDNAKSPEGPSKKKSLQSETNALNKDAEEVESEEEEGKAEFFRENP